MPIGIKFSNFAFSTLAVGCNAAATSLALASGTGAKFPTLAAGEYFYATLENASLDREVVKVTARSTDTITVVRGQDNTTARSWNAGDSLALRLNAGALDDFKAEVVDATNLIRTSNNTFTGTNTFSTAPTFGTDLAIADGGTGAGTAATAFDNLKQAATDAYAGVVKLATSADVVTGTNNTRVLTPAALRSASIVFGASNAASGTFVDFTNIPSWVKRITVTFVGVSTNGTSSKLVQIGHAGVTSTGYNGAGSGISSTVGTTGFATGFGIRSNAAADALYGALVLTQHDTSLWVATGMLATPTGTTFTTSGALSLGSVLDTVRVTTQNGTDVFDGGFVNLHWE